MKAFKSACIFIFLIFLAAAYGFADSWTLASQKFDFRQKGKLSVSSEQIATVLPQLILEQITQNGARTIPVHEQMDRELNELQTKRLSLFLQLSKESKARDALVLSKDKPSELRKNIRLQDEKIQDLEKQIDENLAAVKETRQKYAAKFAEELEKENKTNDEKAFNLPFAFLNKENTSKPVIETVEIYKNDNTALFTPSEAAINGGLHGFQYTKETTAAKINGLLTGEISLYGDYVSVTVNLYVFPGGKASGSVTEVGNASDLMSLAQNVIHNLKPKIANSLPVKIAVQIEPQDAAANAIVSIDGVIHSASENLIVGSGIHTITVSAPEYESQTITYAFTGEELFTVKTKLKPLVSGALNIRLRKYKDGIFYFNAQESASVDKEENRFASASVNGRAILGVFTEKDGESAFIYIPANLAVDSSMLKVNAKPYSREKNIDKRRRWMYTAYSTLICSLIPTFYCIGNFTAYNNSYNNNRATYEDALEWQQKSYYAMGVSYGAGAWFCIELVRYLMAANEVLPATATTTKK